MPATRLRGLEVRPVLGHAVPVASGPVRLLGLAGLSRGAAGTGLLIPRCRSVHTFGMRFELDLVFIGRDGVVIATERRVPPSRVVGCRDAMAVLELPSDSPERGRSVRGWGGRHG